MRVRVLRRIIHGFLRDTKECESHGLRKLLTVLFEVQINADRRVCALVPICEGAECGSEPERSQGRGAQILAHAAEVSYNPLHLFDQFL